MTIRTTPPKVNHIGRVDPKPESAEYREWHNETMEIEDRRDRQARHGEPLTKIVTISGQRVEVEMDLDPEQYEIVSDEWGQAMRKKTNV